MASPDDNQPTGPQYRMRQTRPATLVVTLLAAAAVSWLGIDNFYGIMPRLPWLPPLTMLVLGLGEAYAAWHTKAWVDRRTGATPVAPLVIARYVVLAKASALVGALFCGIYCGLTGWLLLQRETLLAADRDLPPAVVGVIGSATLVVGALLLERACRVPGPPPGSQPGSPPGSSPGSSSGSAPGAQPGSPGDGDPAAADRAGRAPDCGPGFGSGAGAEVGPGLGSGVGGSRGEGRRRGRNAR
jgi:hypothetical protein